MTGQRSLGPNPNNCETCNYKRNPQGGHCYMFREEPTTICAKHTGGNFVFGKDTIAAIEMIKKWQKGSS